MVRLQPDAPFPPTPEWERTSTSTGYAVVYCPNHPAAWSTGYVYVHRVVAELSLGRFLTRGEHVHHKNGDRRDNTPENLEVLCHAAHAREHATQRILVGSRTTKLKAVVRLKCPECATFFVRATRCTHIRKPSKLQCTFCTPRCRGLFSRRAQLAGLSHEMRKAITENVVESFLVPRGSGD